MNARLVHGSHGVPGLGQGDPSWVPVQSADVLLASRGCAGWRVPGPALSHQAPVLLANVIKLYLAILINNAGPEFFTPFFVIL